MRRVGKLVSEGVLERDGDGEFVLEASVLAHCNHLRKDEATQVEKRSLLRAQAEATRARSQAATGASLPREEILKRLARVTERLWSLRVAPGWSASRLEKAGVDRDAVRV